MSVFGYLDRFSFRPGDEIACRFTSTGPVTADLVRLIHGDTSPEGPGFRSEDVSAVPPVTAPGGEQPIYPGSFLHAETVVPSGTAAVRFSVLAWPTLPVSGAVQGVLSLTTVDGSAVFSLALDETGRPCLSNGTMLDRPLRERRWYQLTAEAGPDGVALTAVALDPVPGEEEPAHATGPGVDLAGASGVVAAAVTTRPSGCYNGKLERPEVRDGTGLVLAAWTFEREMTGDRAVDVSGRERHGRLVNAPARAMTGPGWTGETLDWRTAPEQYGAVHFHEDDLADAGWTAGAHLSLPPDLRSGIYAVRLRCAGHTDHIPFAVRATGARADVAFLLPTFTYLAYANEQTGDPAVMADPLDVALRAHPGFGKSLYDRHRDGSGICHSTGLRPILTLRPDYRHWHYDAPRHFGADLYLADWLEHSGVEFDVLTDHDLHAEGAAALEGYQVVLTGSHPEYHSTAMLDALHGHVRAGRCLMYLGGNGFYWVTSQRSSVIEVRRSRGVRSWEAAPGEGHHASTGEPGGLWRERGRSPNALTGIGMAAHGWSERGRGYVRTAESREPRWAWVFEGIDDDVLGDFGLVMGGASGDELDRFDSALGSPPHTAVLATSQPHDENYHQAVEDVLEIRAGLSGPGNPAVRADLVLVEHPSGGAVFSAGSIAFLGSLSHDEYRNNVSQLVANVLDGFRRR
ncbi:N,N-dimethylformamidase beta subunit family domain-containing protein [Amycolatopsis silviterrae]|uniref:N,N-dimethylformamidase beta subunit family domain-containing protein n=1 Tax=Amycolatopsis silviterrae TaxID=1656914 RepID=A0ABW5H325_9PSEU